MEFAQIQQVMGAQLQTAWDNCLRDLAETSTPEEMDEALEWVTAQRDEFLAACEDISDTADLEYSIAMMYIESKSSWIMYNTKIGYEYLSKGAAEPMTVLQASLISHFIAVLEPLLDHRCIEEITTFLAEPAFVAP